MISKRLARTVFGTTCLAVLTSPAVAMAAKTSTASSQAAVVRPIAAALTMAIAATSAAFAQSRIGSAAAGTLAERPESATYLIVLEALPEIIVLMGFVIAFLINNG